MMMINPTMSNRWNRSVDWPPFEHQEKESPAKRSAGSHLPVVAEKLIGPQTTHTQIKYQYAGQSLTKAKLRRETIKKCYIQRTT